MSGPCRIRRRSARSCGATSPKGPRPTADSFVNSRGGTVTESTNSRLWAVARQRALTENEATSPLARRPYDLRHAPVSTWLSAGVDPAVVAEWAGHSVAVLLRVYAKAASGRDEHARRRVQVLLDDEQRSGSAEPGA